MERSQKRQIKQAKIDLLAILLKISTDDLTDNEIEIVYLLASDVDIQQKLKESLVRDISLRDVMKLIKGK
jgi:hypothetical protein